MSFYVNRIVVDANSINARGTIPAMTEIEGFFSLRIVELLQTGVLPVEFENFPQGLKKAGAYESLGSPHFAGHSKKEFSIGVGRRASRFKEIYETLWGTYWKMGGKDGKEIHPQSLRDAIHLDVCWVNAVDIFITSDRGILDKREELVKIGFDVRLFTPDEALDYLRNSFRNCYQTDDPQALSLRLRSSGPLLLGSNSCFGIEVLDSRTTEVLLATRWLNNELHIEANFYDEKGTLVARVKPEKVPEILHETASLATANTSLKTYSLNAGSGTPPRQYLNVGDCNTSNFVFCSGNVALSGHLLPSGHLLIQGKLFDSAGSKCLEIERNELRVFSAVTFLTALPPH